MPHEINRLIKGYQEFRKQYFEEKKYIYDELTIHGQHPKILVIACSDSRVDPVIVTNCMPGELFVIRNVANLVPPYEKDNSYHGTSAALEYGVCSLGIKHIIVFGHSNCGGITNLLNLKNKSHKPKEFVDKWTELAKPALKQTLKEHEDASLQEKVYFCGQYSLINSLNNLRTFPWVKERETARELFLHAWNFNLSTGIITSYDAKKDAFVELSD